MVIAHSVERLREHADLLRLALIGAALDCSNASRDGKCLRYPKKWRENESSVGDLLRKFRSRIEEITEDLATAPLAKTSARVTIGDARALLAPKRSGQKFRLCVTSPPYLNSFDYSDVYRPELFLGRFVESNAALMKVRLKTVRSHVQANSTAPKKDKFGVIYATYINEIRQCRGLWDPRIPKMVQAYFEGHGQDSETATIDGHWITPVFGWLC